MKLRRSLCHLVILSRAMLTEKFIQRPFPASYMKGHGPLAFAQGWDDHARTARHRQVQPVGPAGAWFENGAVGRGAEFRPAIADVADADKRDAVWVKGKGQKGAIGFVQQCGIAGRQWRCEQLFDGLLLAQTDLAEVDRLAVPILGQRPGVFTQKSADALVE